MLQILSSTTHQRPQFLRSCSFSILQGNFRSKMYRFVADIKLAAECLLYPYWNWIITLDIIFGRFLDTGSVNYIFLFDLCFSLSCIIQIESWTICLADCNLWVTSHSQLTTSTKILTNNIPFSQEIPGLDVEYIHHCLHIPEIDLEYQIKELRAWT